MSEVHLTLSRFFEEVKLHEHFMRGNVKELSAILSESVEMQFLLHRSTSQRTTKIFIKVRNSTGKIRYSVTIRVDISGLEESHQC